MRKLIAIVLHPVDYFRLVKMREYIIMLQVSAMMLGIDEPSVWDVDRVHTVINSIYHALHENHNILDGCKTLKKHFFWTLLISKFKQLEISREKAKTVIDFYEIMKNLSNGDSSLLKLVKGMNSMVDNFWMLYEADDV